MNASSVPVCKSQHLKTLPQRVSFKTRHRVVTACRLGRGFIGIMERHEWEYLSDRERKLLLQTLLRMETQLRRKAQETAAINSPA